MEERLIKLNADAERLMELSQIAPTYEKKWQASQLLVGVLQQKQKIYEEQLENLKRQIK